MNWRKMLNYLGYMYLGMTIWGLSGLILLLLFDSKFSALMGCIQMVAGLVMYLPPAAISAALLTKRDEKNDRG